MHHCDHFKDRIGYRGQKYEVRFTRDGEEHVMGWQPESSGGLADAAKLMPGVTNVRVVEVVNAQELRNRGGKGND